MNATAKPVRSACTVDSWSERDRLGVWVLGPDDETIFEVWDDEARGLVEDGLIDPRDLDTSVLDYCEDLGLIVNG